jgi:uncharacterized protein HemX
MMTRSLAAMAFLAEHAKPLILWVGGTGIFIADVVSETANRAVTGAEKVANLPVPALLALICIVLGMVIWKQDKEAKAERESRQVKEDAKEVRMIQLVDRSSNAMEGLKDAVDDLKAETARQTAHFEGLGKNLIERGLSVGQIPHARRDTPTKRSNA